MNINKLRRALEQSKGRYKHELKQLKEEKVKLEVRERQLLVAEKAMVIIQHVAQMTQKEIEFRVSDLVSHGLAAVFDDPYTYELRYVVRRDKTEADQFWKRGDKTYLPNGGGVRDVSAFALQIAALILSLQQKRDVRPVLFLDEPFKGLKPSLYQERAGKIVQELSKALNVQIVIITHDTALSSLMDKAYKIKLKGRTSHARLCKNYG